MRIPPVVPGTRPELAQLEAGILAERGRISLVYSTLLNSPAMAHGWEQLLSAVRNRNSLPADLREMVILRVAVLNRAMFEFDAHVPHALKAGMSAEKIEAMRGGAEADFTAVERAVLALTDAMTREIDVSDALYQSTSAHFSQQQMLDLVVTIGAYNMVSRFLIALQVGH